MEIKIVGRIFICLLTLIEMDSGLKKGIRILAIVGGGVAIVNSFWQTLQGHFWSYPGSLNGGFINLILGIVLIIFAILWKGRSRR